MGAENSEYLLNRKIHSSWIIMWLSLALLAGTFLSLYTTSFRGWEWLVVAVNLGIVGFYKRTVWAILLAAGAGLLLGLWRGGNELQAQAVFENYYGKMVEIRGIVAEDPSYDTDGDLRMRLKDVVVDEQAPAGVVWVSTSEELPIKRSDVVSISGQLSVGFGTIPAAVYRAEIMEIERPDYADVARDVRDEFAGGIREVVKEPEASLGAGFLVGQKTALPEKLDQELRLLGLTHIVVASGYNLTILIRFARRASVRVSRFTALAFSGGLVYCFALVTGFSPSMTRASLIASLSLLAWYFGRKFHPLVLLSFSAGTTVLINPAYAWGDIGWLLSFTSFIGVIIFAPLLQVYFWGNKKPGNFRQVFIETMSAQLLTLPIIAYVFGQYSPLALAANVLILPLIPLAMLLTFFAGLTGLTFGGLAGLLGWPAEMLLRYMTGVVDKLAALPLANSEIQFSLTFVGVSYLILLVGILFLWRRTGYELRQHNVIE